MAVILDLQQRLSGAVKQAARAAFDIDPGAVSFQYPPRVELGDLALTAPFDLAKTLRRKPREIAEKLAGELATAADVRRAEVAGGGYLNLFLDRGRFAAGAAPLARRAGAGRAAPGQRDRRAHEHQPEQGRPHRPPAQRLPRRHVRAPAAPPRLRRRGPELHRRHRRAGGRRGRRLPAHREEDARRRRAHPGQVRLLLLGPLRAGGRLLRRAARRTRRCRPRCCTRSRPAATTPRGSPSTSRRRIVDCHLATMARLGIRYELLAHESDILRLHFWNRAFELLREKGAIQLRDRGQEPGLLGDADGRGRGRGDRRGQDHRPLERHRHLHRQGHRLPALEARQARPRLPLPLHRAEPDGRGSGPPPAARASPARRSSATRAPSTT